MATSVVVQTDSADAVRVNVRPISRLTREQSVAQEEASLDCDFGNCCDTCDACYKERCPDCVPDLDAYPRSVENSGSQCVPHTGWPWLRGVFAILSLIMMIIDIARWVSVGWGQFWLIKLTHWVYLLSVAYLMLRFVETVILYREFVDSGRIVTLRELDQANLARASRVLLNLTLAGNAVVIFLYWTLLFDIRDFNTFSLILTIYKHGITGVLVIVDAFISAAWLRHRDAIWVEVIAIVWTIWTLVHWALGWVNESGCNCIYGVADWNTPQVAGAVNLGAHILLPAFHWALVFLINYTRNKCDTRMVWLMLPIQVDDEDMRNLSVPMAEIAGHHGKTAFREV